MTLIFLSFLNSVMAPLDDLYADRLTFYIHRRASFYRTTSYYISQMLCSWPVAICEAFLLCVLSFFAVGMSNNGGWAFFYFFLEFVLISMAGTAVSRCLAYSLPTPDGKFPPCLESYVCCVTLLIKPTCLFTVAQSLGPAALLLFVMSACYSPTYRELPAWLRWLAWLSPCAYTYEGVIVAETAWRDVGNVNGQEYAQRVFGIPRVPFDAAPPVLSTPGGVIAFDAYMLLFLTIAFELIGCILLHKSQKWYGPRSVRYQVASGQSLTAPPWKGLMKGGEKSSVAEGTAFLMSGAEDSSGVPTAPPAQLTAKNIIYEVDVDPPVDEKDIMDASKEAEEGLLEATTDDLDSVSITRAIITAREYGQTGKGALAEYVLKRQLGESSLRTSSDMSSMKSAEAELEPAAPGRLRLLSGITAAFEPGSLNALMGESGAGSEYKLISDHVEFF